MPADGLDRWIIRTRPRPGAALRLIALPPAGAGTSIYFDWAACFPDAIELCAVQPPGRESRLAEPPIDNASTFAGRLAEAILPLLDRPFAVFGHSLGSLIGFELIRQLAALGIAPMRFFPSASRPPHYLNRKPPRSNLGDEQIIDALAELGGTPEAVLANRELMALAMPAIRADFRMHERYWSDATLDVPIEAFFGLVDPEVPAGLVGAWAPRSSVSFALHPIDGDHFFIRTHKAAVADVIACALLG